MIVKPISDRFLREIKVALDWSEAKSINAYPAHLLLACFSRLFEHGSCDFFTVKDLAIQASCLQVDTTCLETLVSSQWHQLNSFFEHRTKLVKRSLWSRKPLLGELTAWLKRSLILKLIPSMRSLVAIQHLASKNSSQMQEGSRYTAL